MSACEQRGVIATLEDHRAELREVVRALCDGEVAGLELWRVSLMSMSLAVMSKGGRMVSVTLTEGRWRVEGGTCGGDLMALVKGAADGA